MSDQDDAFMSGLEEPEFAGRRLKPFNPIRRFAADCMGLRFFKLHSESWEDYKKSGTYAGALDDAILIVWLRWVEDAEVFRCRTHPLEQGQAMWRWAAEAEIVPGSENHAKVQALAMAVIVEIMEALAEPVGKPERTQAEETGPIPALPTGPTFAESSTESPDSAPERSSVEG